MAKPNALWRLALSVYCLVLPGVNTVVQVESRAQADRYPSLAKLRSLKCVFPLHATGTWVNGEPTAQVENNPWTLEFDSIDTDEGTARTQGASTFSHIHVTVRLATESLHLLEIRTIGSLNVTTVFDRINRDGKLKAVHTRHDYTEAVVPGFTSRPEQHYGECEVTQQ
jgi:hypothetical protein